MQTTQDLVNEVISRIDVNNRESVRVNEDIMPALNGGWSDAMDVIASRAGQLLMSSSVTAVGDLKTDGNSNKYLLVPEDCYQQRIRAVNIQFQGSDTWNKSEVIDAAELWKFEQGTLRGMASTDSYYMVMGRKIVLLPQHISDSIRNVRLLYIKRAPKLVLPQGRVVSWDSNTSTVTVDSIGSTWGVELSITTTDVNNFMNVINGATGEIRSTHQILAISGNTVTIRSTPTRSTFQNLAVTGSFDTNMTFDDYICVGSGSCVPLIEDPVTTMVLTYAITKMKEKLGEADVQMLDNMTKRYENKTEELALNMPNRTRIRNSAPWARRRR